MNNRKQNKALGNRLRHLTKQRDQISQAEALELIHQFGDNQEVINAPGMMNWSPIFWSVLRHNKETAHALMQAPGLNINARDIFGFNILAFAFTCGPDYDHELIKYLLSRDDINLTTRTYAKSETHNLFKPNTAPQQRHASALFYATRHRKLFQYIPELLEKGVAGVNDYIECEFKMPTCFCDGQYTYESPLTNLVQKIQSCTAEERPLALKCIELIANSEAVNTFNKIKYQPKDEALLFAASSGDKDVVEILLAAGANRDLTDTEKRNAATLARFNKHYEISGLIMHYQRPARRLA